MGSPGSRYVHSILAWRFLLHRVLCSDTWSTDPERPGFRCVQGFVNLLPCGENDGGLVVLKAGHKISEEYHNEFRNQERGFRWTNEVGWKQGFTVVAVLERTNQRLNGTAISRCMSSQTTDSSG